MAFIVTYGIGGYCADCDPSHDHPLHNIVAQQEVVEDSVPQINEVTSLLANASPEDIALLKSILLAQE